MADDGHGSHPAATSSEAHAPESTDADRPRNPSETTPLGLAGRLFEVIVRLSVQIPRRIRHPDHVEALQGEIQRLFLWGTCFSASQGNLDEILSHSPDLRHAVLRALFKLASVVQNGLLEIVGRSSAPQLEVSQLEGVVASARLEEAARGVSYVLNKNNIVGESQNTPAIDGISADISASDDLSGVLEDMKIYVDCLMDLSLAIESPVMKYRHNTITTRSIETFDVDSEEAIDSCQRLRRQFPNMDKYLVERLGEADGRCIKRIRDIRSEAAEQTERRPEPAGVSNSYRSKSEPTPVDAPHAAQPGNASASMQSPEIMDMPNHTRWQSEHTLERHMTSTPTTRPSSRSDSVSTIASFSPPYSGTYDMRSEYAIHASHARSASTSALAHYLEGDQPEDQVHRDSGQRPTSSQDFYKAQNYLHASDRPIEGPQHASRHTNEKRPVTLPSLSDSIGSKRLLQGDKPGPRRRPRTDNPQRRHHGWSRNRPIRDEDFEANCEWCPFYLHQPALYWTRPWTSCRRQRAEISHIIAHLISDHGLIRGTHPERRSQRYITRCSSWDVGIKGRGDCAKCSQVSLWDEDDKRSAAHAGAAMCLRCYASLRTKTELFDHLSEPELCIYNEDYPMKKKARILYTTFASLEEFPDFRPSPVVFPPRDGAKRRNMKVEARPVITLERLHDIQLHVPETFSNTQSGDSRELPRHDRLPGYHSLTLLPPSTEIAGTTTRPHDDLPSTPPAFSLPPLHRPDSLPTGQTSLPGIAHLLSRAENETWDTQSEPSSGFQQTREN